MYVAKTELKFLYSRRESSTLIQKTWRRFKDQKQYFDSILAVIDLQRATRGCLVRSEFRKQNHAALIIQQAWWDCVSHWEMQSAAVAIQSAWRCSLAREQVSFLAQRRDAASSIQRVWRGHFQCTLYSIFLDSAISLQKVVRGHLSRKTNHFQRCSSAATTIQNAWRSFSVQVQFQMNLLDIISIQTLFRCREAKKKRESRIQSVAVLQSACRCALARRVRKSLFDEKRRKIQSENAALTCQVGRYGFFLEYFL
jgi:myosin heavy subunit